MRSEPAFDAWFACARPGCAGLRHRLDQVLYRCPRCGGLLEVEHDRAALRARPAEQWRALLDQRAASCDPLDTSGVWAQREWILPNLSPTRVVTLGEGRSPLLPASGLATELGLGDLWLKQCGTSHTGSFKDLGMTVLVSQVNRLRAGGAGIRGLVCASTGDTSAALAAYGARAGIPTIVLLPRDQVSLAQLLQPVASGALVLALETDFDGCMKLVRELTADGSLYLANSLNALRLEGQKSLAIELLRQLGWAVPDWVIVPGGNLGNVFALGRGFELARDLGLVDRLPRLVCAQAAAANPLYRAFQSGFERFEPQTAGPTAATAIRIGDPVSLDRAIRALRACDGVVEQATEDELADAAARTNREGFFCCPHTGVAMAALVKLAGAGAIAPGSRVVVIATAHGLKFPEWQVRYHEGRLEGAASRRANPALELPADLSAVRRLLDQRLDG